MRCPVVVHRWFVTGEGWAWQPDLAPGDFVVALERVLRERPSGGEVQIRALDGGPPWWFCHHITDPEPLDSKARERHPSILRAVALPRRLKDGYRDQLADHLAGIDLPDSPGPDPRLLLDVPEAWLEAGSDPQEPLRKVREGQTVQVRSTPNYWRWRILGVATIGIVCVTLCLVLLGTNARSAGGVQVRQVREKLLEPLGVKLPASAHEAEVCREFQKLYCQRGMIERFFPDAKLEDIKKLGSRESSDVQDAATPSEARQTADQAATHSEHPDVLFARQNAQKFWEAIRYLPEAPEPMREGLLQMGNSLSRAVNAVAKLVPPEVRGMTVVDDNAVTILENVVVKPLRESGLAGGIQSGKYEEWFYCDFRWKEGTPFPWDKPADQAARHLALLFCRVGSAYKDQQEAAREMYVWLKARGVQGIDEEDCRKRPWFVGRAFVEFLSLKHLALSDDEQRRLDGQNSFVWQCLRLLPSEGWESNREETENGAVKPDATDPWKMIDSGLRTLARRLGVSTSGSETARVQAITNTIQDWSGKKFREFFQINYLEQEHGQIDQQVREIEKNLSGIPLDHPERERLEAQRRELINRHLIIIKQMKELEQLAGSRQREEVSALRSGNIRVDRLWERLTGDSLDNLERKLEQGKPAVWERMP